MKYIKKFNENLDETEYGKFFEIDITDVYSFTFFWSNLPFISDYKDKYEQYGTAEKRVDITKTFREILNNFGIQKERFKNILIEKGFDLVDYNNRGGDYQLFLSGQDVIEFFDIFYWLEKNRNSFDLGLL